MPGSTKTTEQATQNATTSNAVDPAQLALLTSNYQGAQTRANSMTPYSGPTTAGFTPTQTQAQGILTGVATDPTYQNNNNGAISSLQGILNQPQYTTVTPQPISASTYDPSLLKGVNLSPYEDPFTKDVIQTSVDQNERARQMAQVNDSQAATAAGAFGGSRSGVTASLTNGEYDRNNQANIANLNSQNFLQAQNAAIGDVNAQNTAKQYNATNTQNAGIFNSGQGLTAQQDTIANNLAAQGLKLNAAGQLVSTNNNGLALASTQGGILSAVGDAQQAQNQTEINNAISAYMQGQQLTVQQQQLLNSALGLIPNQQTVTSSGSSTGTGTQTRQPGLLDYINAAAGVGKAAAGAGAF